MTAPVDSSLTLSVDEMNGLDAIELVTRSSVTLTETVSTEELAVTSGIVEELSLIKEWLAVACSSILDRLCDIRGVADDNAVEFRPVVATLLLDGVAEEEDTSLAVSELLKITLSDGNKLLPITDMVDNANTSKALLVCVMLLLSITVTPTVVGLSDTIVVGTAVIDLLDAISVESLNTGDTRLSVSTARVVLFNTGLTDWDLLSPVDIIGASVMADSVTLTCVLFDNEALRTVDNKTEKDLLDCKPITLSTNITEKSKHK